MASSTGKAGVVAPKQQIELYSGTYFGACAVGGALACGPTHFSVAPLDVVKCRRQTGAVYKSNMEGWRAITKEMGFRGLYLGGGPTFVGYAFQGAFKYGGYEVGKKFYGDAFPNVNKNLIYIAASASAEAVADLFLCPFEAIKVRIQTQIPVKERSIAQGWAKITANGGISQLYNGFWPLLGRQVPYTVIKFLTFEAAVARIYAYLGRPKESYTKLSALGVTLAGGTISGVLCATASHPADVMVSKLVTARNPGEGAMAAISRIYGQIGFRGLWNGLPTRILMISSLTAAQWTIFDAFKVSLGFPTTGSH